MSKKGYKQTQKHKNKLSAAQKGEKGNMWGKHHPQEIKDKISNTLKGRISPMKGRKQTQKARDKCSASMEGKQNRLGQKQTEREKLNHGISMKGKQNRLGTHQSEEARIKIGKAQIGNQHGFKKGLASWNSGFIREENPGWKGGYEATRRRSEEKRRQLGYIPLNDWFIGCEGHHIDKEFIIYVPKEMHRSIYHSVTKNINMNLINDLAIDFCYGD